MTDDEVVAELEVLAHRAKLGTTHEDHDGWTFAVDIRTERPRRVLRCGCGDIINSGDDQP